MLRRYSILDTAPEKDFDDLTYLASYICKAPIALISLVDADRQWFKSKIGVSVTETPREISFCTHAIQQEALFIVPDALADERFATNPLVTSHPNIRFYAGAPLVTSNGLALGTLCVIDYTPRELTPDQKKALEALSRQVMAQLDLRYQLAERRRGQEEIRQLNEALERRIIERTDQLYKANQLLQNEIAERKQAEEERKRTLSLLSSTLESTTDGILVVGKEGKIEGFNQTFIKMWSIPESVISSGDDNKTLSYVLNQLKDPDLFLKKVKDLYTQVDAESDDILEFKDGRVFERYSRPQKLDGKHIGRVWSFRDITEHRKASEALENEVKTLESLVYTISHDLKAPVVSMYGMASLLKEECGDDLSAKAKHYLERIILNASYMETQILDLLALSRIGRKKQSEKKVEAREVVEEILKMNKEYLQEKRVKVKIHSPFPGFKSDHTGLTQLFQNLITNAAKFMGDQANPLIEIGGREVEDGVEFFVKDNGIGIDPAYHEKIFDLFHRLHDVEVEGTGIGLAIVKKIIDQYRGKIWLESQKSKGTTFFFRLPRTKTSPAV